MLEAQGRVICIDPLLIDDPRSADYILITHAHPDHFSLSDIEKLAKKDTIIICPKQVDNRLSAYQTLTMKPEEVANLINTIKPKIAIPIHYEIEKNSAEKFMQLIDKDISVHQSNISTVPVSPLTLTICPSFNKSVAEGIPTTAGIPYSLATIPP